MSTNAKSMQNIQSTQANSSKKLSMDTTEYEILDKHISAGENKLAIELLNQFQEVNGIFNPDQKEHMKNIFMAFLPIAIEAALKTNADLSVIEKLLSAMDVQHEKAWETRFLYLGHVRMQHYPLHYVFHILKNLSLNDAAKKECANNKAKEMITLLINYSATTGNAAIKLRDITNEIRTFFGLNLQKNDATSNMASTAVLPGSNNMDKIKSKVNEKTLSETDTKTNKAAYSVNTPQNAVVKIQAAFRKFSQKKKAIIKNTDWVTGSNGHAVLLGLPHTKQTLKPTGILLGEGIAPMRGELGNGVGINGVNQTSLSGVSANNFKTAWEYANLTHIPLEDLEKSTIKYLKENIESFYKFKSSVGASSILCRINLGILSLRQINEKIYQEQFAKQMIELNKLVQDDAIWHEIIEDKNTRESLSNPALMTLDLKNKIEWKKVKEQFENAGYKKNNWYDAIHFEMFGNSFADQYNDINTLTFIHTLNDYFNKQTLPDMIAFIKATKPGSIQAKHQSAILKFLDEKVLQLNKARHVLSLAVAKTPVLQFSKEELEKMKCKTTLPVVFASSKKLNTYNYSGGLMERLYNGNLTLGKELKLIITNSGSESTVRQYLRKHKLRGLVSVCTDSEFKKEHEKLRNVNAK